MAVRRRSGVRADPLAGPRRRPLYDPRALDALATDPAKVEALAAIVAERQAWLADSLDRYGAVNHLRKANPSCVVVVDMVKSTEMKEQQTQATWLSSLGWMYDTVTAIATEAVPNVDVKYLGDGIMLVFDTDHTTAAVNIAIRIQEAITAASQGIDGAKGVIDFTCSIGISTGEVVGFTTPSGSPDYVGVIVDKAFRLCSAANAKAIWVDTATLGAANTTKITSIFGKAISRAPDQYQGDPQKAPLKGFDHLVAYHEILWDQQLYGVKSATVSAIPDRLRVARPTGLTTPQNTAAPRQAKTERHRGEVTCWRPDKSFGFVRDPLTGEDFHFTPNNLVYPDDTEKLALGKEIAFVAIDSEDSARSGRPSPC